MSEILCCGCSGLPRYNKKEIVGSGRPRADERKEPAAETMPFHRAPDDVLSYNDPETVVAGLVFCDLNKKVRRGDCPIWASRKRLYGETQASGEHLLRDEAVSSFFSSLMKSASSSVTPHPPPKSMGFFSFLFFGIICYGHCCVSRLQLLLFVANPCIIPVHKKL